ncbi:unnamed protein product, partial [Brenthis ino]
MKTQKSSDNEEVTPSKKVLKQARLPFMIISDVSPKSSPTQTRKRKLSAPEYEPVTKVGKITKENELAEESVIISDDDSKDAPEAQNKVDKQLNPFVKLVDTARKKKLQKSKAAKKKKNSKSSLKNKSNCSMENNENSDKRSESVEEMEVDETKEIENTISNEVKISEEDIKNTKTEDNTVILLEDFNCSETNSATHKSDSVTNHTNSDEKCNGETENISQEREQSKPKINNEDAVTPKRSDRIKSKSEDKNLNTSKEDNCEESFNSSPSTPRRSARNVSISNSQEDISVNESSNTSLTPKQLQKKLESAKKKEEREKERLEREKKRQQEKEERAKQRQEKEDRKNEKGRKKKRLEERKRRKRGTKKKRKRRERETTRIRKKEEKEEQKKKEKEAREEEKRKRQEALEQEKLEQEQKKKKAAEAFVSFFVPKQKGDKDQVTVGPVSKNNLLSSFTLKSDMRLAPTIRVNLDAEKQKTLDNHLKEQNVPENALYIKNLKNGVQKPLSNGKTWPMSDKDDQDDVMIIEDELPPVDGAGEIISCDTTTREKLRPKLLAFHENRRPPYWGTWRKKSSSINPRKPFTTDEKLLDYEVDSDEEWEEEQDGESIDGSVANSDEEQDNDEYEVDNEVFVPHGYLSDEEATMDGDDVLSLSPETQKARLKYLEDEFESELKKPMEKLKPRLYGLIWETENGKPEKCVDALWNYFGKLAMIMDDPTPLLQPSNETEEPEKKKVKKKKAPDGEEQSPKNEKKKKKVEEKDGKKLKADNKKVPEKKNQPGINTFLKKIKTS